MPAPPHKLLLIWSVFLLLIGHMSKLNLHMCNLKWLCTLWKISYSMLLFHWMAWMNSGMYAWRLLCIIQVLSGFFFSLGTLIKMNESRHLQLLLQNKGFGFRANILVLTFPQLSRPVDNNWIGWYFLEEQRYKLPNVLHADRTEVI